MLQAEWDKWFAQLTFVNPGQQVFYPIIRQNIVVPATVVEVNDIYSHLVEEDHPTLWVNRYLDGRVEMLQERRDVIDDNGYYLFGDVPFDRIFDYRLINQFIWLDEPTYGHEIQVGDECFLTLPEALKQINPGSKRHLKRRLQDHRRRNNRFVASTWIAAGEKRGPDFPRYPARPIYALRAR